MFHDLYVEDEFLRSVHLRREREIGRLHVTAAYREICRPPGHAPTPAGAAVCFCSTDATVAQHNSELSQSMTSVPSGCLGAIIPTC